MKRTHVGFAAVVMLLIAGCVSGPSLRHLPMATGPEGVIVRVNVGQTEYLGELLETRDNAILLLTRSRVDMMSGKARATSGDRLLRLLPHADVRSLRIELEGSRHGLPAWPPRNPESLARFRLISRFPQGLSDELLHQLLASHGQQEVAGIE